MTSISFNNNKIIIFYKINKICYCNLLYKHKKNLKIVVIIIIIIYKELKDTKLPLEIKTKIILIIIINKIPKLIIIRDFKINNNNKDLCLLI